MHVGHDGVTEAVVRHADAELAAHELVKVRVAENAPGDRHEIAATWSGGPGRSSRRSSGGRRSSIARGTDTPTIVLPPAASP